MTRPLALPILTLSVGILTAAPGCAQVGAPAPAAQSTPAAPHAFVPTPVSVEPSDAGEFRITESTVIVVPPGDEAAARVGRYLSAYIGLAAAQEPPAVQPAGASVPDGAIRLTLGENAGGGDEGYELTIASSGVTIAANAPAGLFYGVQTLRQALPAVLEYEALRPQRDRVIAAPAVRVVDRPRFAWRGAMLDVARHFFSVEDVKRYVELIALHKLNRLHLHLADDQGWRIEITSRPELTRRGSVTEVMGGPGGFYTQEEYGEIVAYAAERFVTIVPEIDMPGHTNAALASYAELNCDGVLRQPFTGIVVGFSVLCVDRPATYAFIDDVIREIAAMTPGPYFHIGGDEVEALNETQYVQFIERAQAIVQKYGKQMIGWDEIAPARLLPTTIVQHWRPDGSPAPAVAQGAKVIMSLANRAYLDMKYTPETPIGLAWAGHIEVEDAYAWDPATISADVPASAILGVEAPLWTETAATIQDVEFLAFPRLAAIADVGWAQAEGRDWNEFRNRLGAQGPRWSALGMNFYRSPAVPWK
jgi:hexosaminidase